MEMPGCRFMSKMLCKPGHAACLAPEFAGIIVTTLRPWQHAPQDGMKQMIEMSWWGSLEEK